jgi:hypothetical protein
MIAVLLVYMYVYIHTSVYVCMCIYTLVYVYTLSGVAAFFSNGRNLSLCLGLKNELPRWYNSNNTRTLFCLYSDIFKISHQGDKLDHYSLFFAELL